MILRRIILMAFSVLPFISAAQEISNINPVIKIVAGEPFYVHEVIQGQDIDAIARAYNSNVGAIEKENPSLTDPLIKGINIRIPYTDESAARMMDVAGELGLQDTPKSRSKKRRLKDQSAIDEAVNLIQEETTVEPIPDEEVVEETISPEDQALLQSLSETVDEGLKDLEEVKDEIAETPYLDNDGLPKNEVILPKPKIKVEAKGSTLLELIDDVSKAFDNGDSLSDLGDLFMREYFLVRVNPDGVITNVRDERTMTNANTRVLKTEDIKGRYLIDSTDQFALQIVPVGINVHLKRVFYPVKIKNGKIKSLSPSITEKYLEEGGKHHDLISSSSEINSLKGAYRVEIVEGSHYLSIHDQFEYNPFGVTLEKVEQKEVLEIISFTVK